MSSRAGTLCQVGRPSSHIPHASLQHYPIYDYVEATKLHVLRHSHGCDSRQASQMIRGQDGPTLRADWLQ